MYISSYREIKDHIENVNRMVRIFHEHNRIPESEIQEIKDEYIKDIKTASRDFYRRVNKYHTDPYSVPVFNDKKSWRSVSTDGGETRTDFIVIPDNGQTDDDIEEFIFTTVGHKSYYDFPTGQLVTLHYYIERIPLGIKIIHECGIDW